jgi:hypothetical protein
MTVVEVRDRVRELTLVNDNWQALREGRLPVTGQTVMAVADRTLLARTGQWPGPFVYYVCYVAVDDA